MRETIRDVGGGLVLLGALVSMYLFFYAVAVITGIY